MTHFVRTQVDATWTTGNYVTLASDWQSLDSKIVGAINGDRGGCWAPISPIILNGTPAVAAINIGTLRIDYGGALTVAGSAVVSVPGASGGWPALAAGHVGRTRTIMHSWFERQSTPLYHWQNNIALGGVQSIACTVESNTTIIAYDPGFGQVRPPNYIDVPIYSNATNIQQPRMLLPLRVHDGARLTQVTLTFLVPTTRNAAPFVPPRLRISRADLSGTTVALASVAAGADATGFRAIASPTNGSSWYAGGAVQSFTYLCDQNQTVDVSQFTYWAELIEEVGTATPIVASLCDGTLVRERKTDVTCASTGPLTRSATPTIDGVVTTAGSIVLVKDQADATQNGIYYVVGGASAWTRLPGLTVQSDFTPGFLVRVSGGTINAATMWECAGPSSTQPITLADGTGTPVTFQRRKPRGNVYIALAVAFDSIADMRYQ